MPKCPECKEEIECLLLQASTVYSVTEWNGKLNFTVYNEESDEEYYCPECLEVIAYTEEEALKFLKGGKRNENNV